MSNNFLISYVLFFFFMWIFIWIIIWFVLKAVKNYNYETNEFKILCDELWYKYLYINYENRAYYNKKKFTSSLNRLKELKFLKENFE